MPHTPFGLAKRYAALLFGSLLAHSAAAQTTYTVTTIGVLPGCVSSAANNLNDQGVVVGQCWTQNVAVSTGFVWQNGVLTSTGKLAKGTYSVATAVNASGTVAGEGDSGSSAMLGWVKRDGNLVNFFSNNGGLTRVVHIADDGTIGGRYTSSQSGWVASGKGALWQPDAKDPRKYRKIILPILPGGSDPKLSYAFPNAFNQQGQAAGWANNDVLGQRAVMWKNDAAHSIVDLGTGIEGFNPTANGMNDLGQVVGETSNGAFSQPVLWNNDETHSATVLAVLPGDDGGYALDINNQGDVLGTSIDFDLSINTVSTARPIVWQSGVPVELQTALDPITGAGVVLTEVKALNNAGQVVGTALVNGQTRAVLLTPTP